MRYVDPTNETTLLDMTLQVWIQNNYIDEVTERLKELLKPERGGQAAFSIRTGGYETLWTPLHTVIWKNITPEKLKWLLDNGALQSVRIRDARDMLPSELAILANKPRLVDILKAAETSQLSAPPQRIGVPYVPGVPDTLGEFTDPIEKLYSGFTKSDEEIVKLFFENPTHWGMCPICLEYVERSEACEFIGDHICKRNNRNERLHALYSSAGGKVEFCSICGRITHRHRHYALTDGSEEVLPELLRTKAELGIQDRRRDATESYTKCDYGGGGNVEEKVHRFRQLLVKACELQQEVGKKPNKEVRDALILDVWKAPIAYPVDAKKILEEKKFDYPCEFPETSAYKEGPASFPDIPSPNPVPTKHEAPDNKCYVNFDDPHEEDNRPTFAMPHKVGDEIKDHGGQKICVADLIASLDANGYLGKCPFEPACEGLVHPADIKPLLETLTQRMVPSVEGQAQKPISQYKQEVYERFYSAFYEEHPEFLQSQKGGAEPTPLLTPMTDGTCSVRKKGARRRTYRRNVRGRTLRRTSRRRNKNGRGFARKP